MRSELAAVVTLVRTLSDTELAMLARIVESEGIARQVAAMGSRKDATE